MRGRDRILAFLKGEATDRPPLMPITMMFAARQVGARYREYCLDYRTLAEAQIQTAERFHFDYVNTMSDPAREAADCGADVEFFDQQPAALVEDRALLQQKSALGRLTIPDPSAGKRMSNGLEAVACLKKRVGSDKLVEGWIEGPCAEAADLRGINTLMLDFYDDPPFVQELFEFVVEMELRFAKAQVQAGADLIGIGDAAASLIGPKIYERFVWPFEKKLIDGVHALPSPVRLHICGNTRLLLAPMGRLGAEIVDLDFLAPLAEGRQAMGPRQILLGNLDPVAVIRDGDPQQVFQGAARCHREAGRAFIVGAGCEIPADSPPENVLALAEYARSAGRQFS